MNDIPDWAGKRACRLLSEAEEGGNLWLWPNHAHYAAVKAVAKLVMQHETAPVDPDEEAVKRIADAICFCVDAHAYFSLHPDRLARAVRQYKQEKANG